MLRLALTILWPSFLVAIVAEGCFFSMFDPSQLTVIGEQIELSAIAVYTLGFFFFWVFCALASVLTYYLLKIPTNNKSSI
ncbi:MAG: hypothetical protein JSS58_09115 [Proteobacteria bacterium]|nr:hypothetical protein [Pseudomonadota bacterium]